MANATAQVQCRLRPHARLLLRVAAVMSWMGMKIPHGLVVAVTNRSWQMRIEGADWFNIRIDNQGRWVR